MIGWRSYVSYEYSEGFVEDSQGLCVCVCGSNKRRGEKVNYSLKTGGETGSGRYMTTIPDSHPSSNTAPEESGPQSLAIPNGAEAISSFGRRRLSPYRGICNLHVSQDNSG